MKIIRRFSCLLIFVLLTKTINSQTAEKPKLVVGIVVDQMRFDYLNRFKPFFGKGGFARLMKQGSNFTFAHYNYELTSTGPGHASIYTGSTPYYHGIIGNDFYDKRSKLMVNCVVDSSHKSVGSDDADGSRSPHRLLSNTITDQLKLSTAGKSKVISVSIKDRGAVLPGGHFPDGAYWFNRKTGDFITSTYYKDSLPEWVKEYNSKKRADVFLAGGWHLSLPYEAHNIMPSDDSKYEKDMFKEGKTYFPHSFENLVNEKRFESIPYTPFGNSLVSEIAKEALANEELGKRNDTDFLAVSFSCTDYIGHEYGTYSYELMDAYIKLDSLLADLLSAFDRQVGAGNYILFLTADHAAMETQAYLNECNIPTGELRWQTVMDSLNSFIKYSFGEIDLIENYSNKQIFLNRETIRNERLDINQIELAIAGYIRDTFPEVASIYTRDNLETQMAVRIPQNFILNGYNPSKSGDIAFNLQPGYLNKFQPEGTQHGSSYAYDTHVPLLFYGWHIPAQTVNTPVYIVDIAATIADLLMINEPSACIGIPLIK